jgi:hypothetical protein
VAEQAYVVFTIRIPASNLAEARQLAQAIKSKIADTPGVVASASISQRVDLTES